MHYSSNQKILLVGEGNFSFAACLAKNFGSAKNMVATSLDSKESVILNYSTEAASNLKELEDMGCVILHEVDVHTMTQHPLLVNQLFDCVVFNFPHAGFMFREQDQFQIYLHQNLVRGFLASAYEMLNESGQVHVTHKTAYPFSKWEIVKLAEDAGLFLVEEAWFSIWDYPGYINKRGSGSRCNETFPVGECSTYKFAKPQHLEQLHGVERWIKHYSSNQTILLVGEGDFSFALCLATEFGSGRNVIATSLDSKEDLVKYSKAKSNLNELEDRGCQVLHGVDVNTMQHHPELINKKFDRIIYNFPHAGYLKGRCRSSEKERSQIMLHQNLMRGYFMNSREMLTKKGEIHVTHKTSYPFSEWEIKKLAEEAELFLVKEVEFNKQDYPGYKNKRGDGNCDESFSTFIFAKRYYPKPRFHPGTLSISTWPADVVDMACTYLDSLEMKKSKRGQRV